MAWTPTRDREKYGVAIYNFCSDINGKSIKLNVGDTVHILEEFGDLWYFGYAIHNKALRGIFPKSFIHVRDCIVDKTSQVEVVVPRQPPIVQEIIAVLREWGVLLRKLYLERSTHFTQVKDTMTELMLWHKKILSGQLPGDEMKQLKHRVTRKIDLVNVLLGLDLVVRDDHGNVLNPDITSSMKLFKYHNDAASLLRKIKDNGDLLLPPIRNKPHPSWTALLSIANIIIKVPEPSEILLGLYTWDVREGKEKPLTELFIIPWTEEGYNRQPDLLSRNTCLFVDLNNAVLDECQILLIGTVVRSGSMAIRDIDPRRVSSMNAKKPTVGSDAIKRPCGVILRDVTNVLRVHKKLMYENGISNLDEDIHGEEHFAPYFQCTEKESFDLRKLLFMRNDALRDNKTGSDSKTGLGLMFTLQLINGNIRQLRETNPQYMALREDPLALRLGLSDIVMPGDVRNDLYVTIVCGEFNRGDRNVEVTMRVCDENGDVVPGVIQQGCSKPPMNEYQTVTYHREGKPRWMETVKIALRIEEFKRAHLKFFFKHRSEKDKSEKLFAISFVKLMQENGTTLQNTDHELILYKVDRKNWREDDHGYIQLPWKRLVGEEQAKVSSGGLSLSTKESFTISTVFCSTKLTQNADLLALLECDWDNLADKATLLLRLERMQKICPNELLVFLQDTLDVLLKILINNADDNEMDNKIFEAFISVISIATDKNKHEAFQPVLDAYIEQNFASTLAYNKLIHVLKYFVKNAGITNTVDQETLKKAMKCIQYLFKLIIKSRQLFHEIRGQGQEEFEKSLQQLLEEMAYLMKSTSDNTHIVQAQCLKYITTAIPDIIVSFDAVVLSKILVEMISNLIPHRITRQKLLTMNEVIHSALFKIPACRCIILPSFILQIHTLLMSNEEVTDSDVVMRKDKTNSKLTKLLGDKLATAAAAEEKNKVMEELELSVDILGDIFDVLFSSDVGSVHDDISLLVQELLHDILAIVCRMSQDNPLTCKFVSILVDVFRQMTEKHFQQFLSRFNTLQDRYDFISMLLMVIQNLVAYPVFPFDWAEMILLQNSVIVKVLRQCSIVISENMKKPFHDVIWNNFFHCAVKFVTQPSLQLETFTQSKRNKILSRYRDMRQELAKEVKRLWFCLDEHKFNFVAGNGVTSMVGPFLEMTMIPVVELRRNCIPIFYDMMQCEFYSVRESKSSPSMDPDAPELPFKQRIKGKFDEFEHEILKKLDHLVEGGHGDEHYRDVFRSIIAALCQESLREPGLRLVDTVTRLMDRLLQYRTIMNTTEHSAETRMSCTVNLLDFYSEINRKELYLRYVYKLSELHLKCDNYTEAGYTLLQHAKLLKWSSDVIPEPLRAPKLESLCCHIVLKEELYNTIIGNFDKGKMWEVALELCQELFKLYREVTFEYHKLSTLLTQMSLFYANIINPQTLRHEPEYFRVAYYGRGFPAFLQNKIFIYRGNAFERLGDFTSRILDQFPNAELMTKLNPPTDEMKDSPHQYVQINKVDCVMQETKFSSKPDVEDMIERYYRFNHITTFTFSRPFHRGIKDPTNEFSTLWLEKTTHTLSYSLPGILRCFPVIKTVSVELSPLENAVDTMITVNADLKQLVKNFDRDATLPLDSLTRKVSGMVDAAVMGGVANYEKAFLTDEYMSTHPEDIDRLDALKRLISEQIPLLELALGIHAARPDHTALLHEHMVSSFIQMKNHVQELYGVSELPSDLHISMRPLTLRSHQSLGSETSYSRNSQYSNDGISGISVVSASTLSIARFSLTPNKMATLPRSHKTSSPLNLSNGNIAKNLKKEKTLRTLFRRDSMTVSRDLANTNTQWFDRPESNSMKICELSEQIIPERPMRSEVDREVKERQISRPNSMASSVTLSLSPSTGSQESLVSIHSEIGDMPPPLPMKMRDQEGDSGLARISAAFITSLFDGDQTDPAEPPPKPPLPDRT